jgi:hypothetical protein
LFAGVRQNFDDMPPLHWENNPSGVGEGENQEAVTGMSESGALVILPRVFAGEPGLLFADICPSFGGPMYLIHRKEGTGGWLFR